MDNAEFFEIFDLEKAGKSEEAFHLLEKLADLGHPMAILELAMRYFSIEGYVHPVYPIEQDEELSSSLEKRAKEKCEELAALNDGDAMRMLGNYYLGLWGLGKEKNLKLGEKWLVDAYECGCFFAANDLATFYQSSDLHKARYYYQEVTRHSCRVIYHSNLEP